MRILLLLLLTSGCATTIENEWKSAELRQSQIKNIAVFGLSGSATTRLSFEGTLTKGLRERGVNAIAGYEFIKADEKPTREEIVAKLKQANVDAVLITHVVDRQVETHTQSTPLYNAGWAPAYRGGWYGYYGNYYQTWQVAPAVPSVVTTTEEVTYFVDTILYSVDGNEPLYANRSATTRSRPDKFANDITGSVSRVLKKEHVALVL